MAASRYPRSKDSIYVMCGDNGTLQGRIFEQYDVSTNAWTRLLDLPANCGTSQLAGGALAFTPIGDFERLYALGGQGSQGTWFGYFWHSSQYGTWYTAGSFTHAYGCALCYGGTRQDTGYLYALQGNGGSAYFERYAFSIVHPGVVPATGYGWITLASYGYPTGYGAALAYVPRSSSFQVFGLRGAGTTTFRGYNISGNTWGDLDLANANVGLGGCMAAKTVGGNNDSIYALLGNGGQVFDVYSIDRNHWYSAPGNVPDPYVPGAGAGLAYCPKDRDFYATMGGGTTNFLQYAPYSGGLGGGQGSAMPSRSSPEITLTLVNGRCVQMAFPAVGRDVAFRAFDASGREVWKTRSSTGVAEWQLDVGLPAGAYCLLATTSQARGEGRIIIPK